MTQSSRNGISEIWGERTPYIGHWPSRIDQNVIEEPDQWIQSCCVLCSNGCAMDIGVKSGRIVGVRGRDVDRVNSGRLGPKGLYGWQANHSGDRLTRPLIRTHGRFHEASWEDAMAMVVTNCQRAITAASPNSVGIYNSGQLFHEEYYTLAKVAYAGIGTNQIDGNTRLCTSTASQALRETFGSDGQPCSYTDLDVTDCLFLIGTNMAETQTVLWSRVLDRRAGSNPPKLIVADPRRTPTAAAADVHLQPRLGTNVALMNGLVYLLIAQGAADHEFLECHTQGYRKLADVVGSYPPERTAELTQVPVDQLQYAAQLIAESQMLVSCVLQGVYQANQATAAACQVNNLNLVLGRIGRPGCGVMQMNGQPTAQNCRESGCDGEFPFFLNYQNPQHVQRWADLWNVDPNRLPHWHLNAHAMEIFRHVEVGSIRFLWIVATNPAVSMPELHRVRRLLSQDRLFLVVQDAFFTETAQLADVVLPAAMWGEKTGCFTNIDRTVHISHKAIDPPGDARADLDIFLDFAGRMDFRDRDGNPLIKWTDAEGAFNDWARCSKGWFVDYSGLTYEKLSRGSGIQWPCNEQWPDGCERIYTDLKFRTSADVTQTYGHDLELGAARSPDEYRANDPQGRAILKPAHYIPADEQPDGEYPFMLTTGRVVYHFHTRTKTGRTPELQAAAPDVFVELSQVDATRLRVNTGDEVEVVSRRGMVRAKARISELPPGTIFIPFHYGYWDQDEGHHRAANELTMSAWDPVSKQPLFKYAAVQLRKAGALRDLGQKIVDAADRIGEKAKDLGDAVLSGMHPAPRCHVPDALGQLEANLAQFSRICRSLEKSHFQDFELGNACNKFAAWCDGIHVVLEKHVSRYGVSAAKGPEALVQALFPGNRPGEFGELRDLQSLGILAESLLGACVSIHQMAQGLRDPILTQDAAEARQQVLRTQAWIETQIKHRTVHTLIVPL